MAQASLTVEMRGSGPDGFGWKFTMEYDKLGEYAVDIAQLGESFAALVGNTAGSAASGDPAYAVTFSVTGPDLPEQYKRDKGQIEGKASGLQYSEMLTLQEQGLEALRQLNQAGHNEVASGQRK